MLGYPIGISIGGVGKTVTISGLVPSQRAKSRIVNDLRAQLPASSIVDEMSVVAGSDIVVPDVSPALESVRREIASTRTDIERNELGRTNSRASNRLERAVSDLKSAVEQKPDGIAVESLARITDDLTAARADIDKIAISSALPALLPTYQDLTKRLNAAAHGILLAIGAPDVAHEHSIAGDETPDATMQKFSAEAEHVAALASTVAAAKYLRPAPVAVPTPPPAPKVQPSPRERLEAFAKAHAIFFSTDLDYRDSEATTRWLTELATLAKAAQVTLRLVGYTDETGNNVRNVSLAQERAAKVRDELIARGVGADRILSVGRASALDISDIRGAGTPNRRVEIEIAFEGEIQP